MGVWLMFDFWSKTSQKKKNEIQRTNTNNDGPLKMCVYIYIYVHIYPFKHDYFCCYLCWIAGWVPKKLYLRSTPHPGFQWQKKNVIALVVTVTGLGVDGNYTHFLVKFVYFEYFLNLPRLDLNGSNFEKMPRKSQVTWPKQRGICRSSFKKNRQNINKVWTYQQQKWTHNCMFRCYVMGCASSTWNIEVAKSSMIKKNIYKQTTWVFPKIGVPPNHPF